MVVPHDAWDIDSCMHDVIPHDAWDVDDVSGIANNGIDAFSWIDVPMIDKGLKT